MNVHKHDDGIILWTEQICPPYDNDWSCVDENYDGAPDAGYHVEGRGINEEAAIQDWYEKTAEYKEYHP